MSWRSTSCPAPGGPKHRYHGTRRARSSPRGAWEFARRVLPSASNRWVQASVDDKQRLQELFFSGGLALRRRTAWFEPGNAPDFQLFGSSGGLWLKQLEQPKP